MANNKRRAPRGRAGGAGRQQKYTVLNILIILLSAALAISIVITVFTLRDSGRTYYDSETSLLYELEDGDYAGLAERYYNAGIGHEDARQVRQVAEYYAVGRYFEKAFFANAFAKAGNTEKAQQYHELMNALEPEMGEFASEKEKILQILEP